MTALRPAFDFLAGDRIVDLLDLLVGQWRSAPCRVPGADQFKGDPWIDVATKQMAAQLGDAVIARAFGDAVSR